MRRDIRTRAIDSRPATSACLFVARDCGESRRNRRDTCRSRGIVWRKNAYDVYDRFIMLSQMLRARLVPEPLIYLDSFMRAKSKLSLTINCSVLVLRNSAILREQSVNAT